jgi:flagellar biosynthetic protein FliQ
MTPQMAVKLGQSALETTALVASIPLLSALAIGLVIGMFQAATQINEMTLSFVPKLLVLGVALAMGGPWMLQVLVAFTRRTIESIPAMIG